MKTIVVASHKGGVGKSLTCANLSSALSDLGYRILLCDTDSQANLSLVFQNENQSNKTLYNILRNRLDKKQINIEEYINKTDNKNIDIILGDINLTSITSELERALFSFNFVYRSMVSDIKNLDRYDFLIFDTPPNVGSNSQVLMASDYILIPTGVGRYSTEGVSIMVDLFKNCRNVNSNLNLLGILINNVNVNSVVFKEVEPLLREGYGNYVFDTIIEKSVIAEKIEWTGIKKSKNKFYDSFSNLAREVVNRVGSEEIAR